MGAGISFYKNEAQKPTELPIKLKKSGIAAAANHGDKSQGARTESISRVQNGAIRILVATDIAARGLDIPLLPIVINLNYQIFQKIMSTELGE